MKTLIAIAIAAVVTLSGCASSVTKTVDATGDEILIVRCGARAENCFEQIKVACNGNKFKTLDVRSNKSTGYNYQSSCYKSSCSGSGYSSTTVNFAVKAKCLAS
jgi:hypothetical protein